MIGRKGTTLLELLIAIMMIGMTVVIISLVFPNAGRSITNNRQRMLANNFATARMQELTAQPYASVELAPTNPGVAGEYFSDTGPDGCDCGAPTTNLLHLNMPVDAQYTTDSVTFTRRFCINLVEPGPVAVRKSHCPNDPLDATRDFGLKNIRVQVAWTLGAETFTTDVEGQVTR